MQKAKPEPTEADMAELDTELDALVLLPDDQIDTSDIPDIPDGAKVIRGFFYRPEKREIQLVLDDFVIDWFQENSGGRQDCHEYINKVLLEHIRQCRLRELKETEARIIRQAQERGAISRESAGQGASP